MRNSRIIAIIAAVTTLLLLIAIAYAGAFSSGTVSETIRSNLNLTLTGFCLYGDGTNASWLYFTDTTSPSPIRKTDTLRITAGSYGPECISYAYEGGIDMRGLASVLGGTGGLYGVTYLLR